MVFAVAWREEMSKILFKAGSRRMTRERRERERGNGSCSREEDGAKKDGLTRRVNARVARGSHTDVPRMHWNSEIHQEKTLYVVYLASPLRPI